MFRGFGSERNVDDSRDRRKPPSIRKFKLADDSWTEDEGAWYLPDCVSVYRTPTGGWSERPDARKETLWFVPEISGDADTNPNAIGFTNWINAAYDRQAGRWVYLPNASGVVHVIFEAPPTGIPDGSTVPCAPVSFSDGRDLGFAPGNAVVIENQVGSPVCNTGSRRGTAVTWTDHYMVLNEFRDCEAP